MKIKVLLADDHQIMREGLKALLEKATDIEVVAEAVNGRDALEKVLECRPEVAVMDLNMPEMGGIEATRRITETVSDTKVLVLSMVMDRSCVLESLKAGAKGYLIKDCAADELVGAIRSVAKGQPFLSAIIIDVLIQEDSTTIPEERRPESSVLTTREREILRLISDGKSTKEIAFALGLSIKTIDTHRLKIMKKLNLFTIAQLTKYALREGFTSS
jgi:DNA-binding NarL/FixJ family response regulator